MVWEVSGRHIKTYFWVELIRNRNAIKGGSPYSDPIWINWFAYETMFLSFFVGATQLDGTRGLPSKSSEKPQRGTEKSESEDDSALATNLLFVHIFFEYWKYAQLNCIILLLLSLNSKFMNNWQRDHDSNQDMHCKQTLACAGYIQLFAVRANIFLFGNHASRDQIHENENWCLCFYVTFAWVTLLWQHHNDKITIFIIPIIINVPKTWACGRKQARLSTLEDMISILLLRLCNDICCMLQCGWLIIEGLPCSQQCCYADWHNNARNCS